MLPKLLHCCIMDCISQHHVCTALLKLGWFTRAPSPLSFPWVHPPWRAGSADSMFQSRALTQPAQRLVAWVAFANDHYSFCLYNSGPNKETTKLPKHDKSKKLMAGEQVLLRTPLLSIVPHKKWGLLLWAFLTQAQAPPEPFPGKEETRVFKPCWKSQADHTDSVCLGQKKCHWAFPAISCPFILLPITFQRKKKEREAMIVPLRTAGLDIQYTTPRKKDMLYIVI